MHTLFASHDLRAMCLYCIDLCLFTGHSSKKQVEFRWLKTCSAGSSFLPRCALGYSGLAAMRCWTAMDLSVVPMSFLTFALVLSIDDHGLQKITDDHWAEKAYVI